MDSERAGIYYKHSGAFDFLSPVYMILLGGIGAVVLGAVYGTLIYYMPFIYVNFLATLGLGIAIGWLVSKGGQFGKVRNREMLFAGGIALGLFADYVGWISWIFAASEGDIVAILPADVFAVVAEVAENGAWSLFGDFTPTGIVLYAIWTIQAGIIAGGSGYFAWKTLRHTPFCEVCRRWVKDAKELGPHMPVIDKRGLQSKLEEGDFAALADLQSLRLKGDSWTQIELLRCPGCSEFHLLTVKAMRIVQNSEGKADLKAQDIVRNLIVDAKAYEELSKPGPPPGELAPPSPAAGPASEPAPERPQQAEEA